MHGHDASRKLLFPYTWVCASTDFSSTDESLELFCLFVAGLKIKLETLQDYRCMVYNQLRRLFEEHIFAMIARKPQGSSHGSLEIDKAKTYTLVCNMATAIKR